jgi:hypothetical protein
MRKLWLSEVGGVKIENDITLGSLFLNMERTICNQRNAKFEISCEWKFYNDETTLLIYY